MSVGVGIVDVLLTSLMIAFPIGSSELTSSASDCFDSIGVNGPFFHRSFPMSRGGLGGLAFGLVE